MSYWSSSTSASSTDLAWLVHMWGGFVYADSKSYPFYVWPVRAGQVAVEVCDGIDNDGDGFIDEGCPAAPTTTTTNTTTTTTVRATTTTTPTTTTTTLP